MEENVEGVEEPEGEVVAPTFEELGFNPIELVEAALSGRVKRSGDEEDDIPLSRTRDMPNIDHLVDAVELNHLGIPIFLLPPGSRVVIERRSGLLHGRPWIDTKVYEVRDVDQDTGLLKLWNPEAYHHARDNFKAGVKVGSRYKIPPVKGKWDVAPKIVKVVAKQATPVALSQDGQPVKRGRGRPPGVKNRSKDAIDADKAIRSAMKSEKDRC